ncbi:energy transducer TonB [Solirubrum puertoriconensis]|nr:energy transducer TonB [Solirubrum puertoriconensis]
MPTFRGSATGDSIGAYLAKTVRYPSQAIRQRLEGRVEVNFVVSLTGALESIKITKSVHPVLDNEAMRVIAAMPPWEPGRNLGKPVRVSYTLPITFQLPAPASPGSKEVSAAPAQRAAPFDPNAGVYTFVEQIPQLEGGMERYQQYLKANLKYPPEALRNKVQGQVLVQFIVGTTGQLRQFKVIKTVHPQLDAEAMRVVQAMSIPWIPGKQNGQAVNVYYTLPVRFRLPGTEPGNTPPTVAAPTPTTPAIATGLTNKYPYDGGPIYPGNPGGIVSIQRFFARELQYPAEAKQRNLEGEVFVRFELDSTGQVQQPVVLRSPDSLLNDEAIRLLKSMPAWKPARYRGRPTRVEVILPVTFSLTQK